MNFAQLSLEWQIRLCMVLQLLTRDVNKARDVKAKNANVNCRENATVNLSVVSHFRYSFEKLQ